jgi:hypothetical protein
MLHIYCTLPPPKPVGVQQRLRLGRRVRDAPAALKYNGELTPHTFGIDQPNDAVLVGFGSAPEHLSCKCANRHEASYREADRRAARIAAGRRQFTLLTCSGATARAHYTAAVPNILRSTVRVLNFLARIDYSPRVLWRLQRGEHVVEAS